ncbi:hypothetical protein FLSU104744_04960 [Flavobacterium succinicans]
MLLNTAWLPTKELTGTLVTVPVVKSPLPSVSINKTKLEAVAPVKVIPVRLKFKLTFEILLPSVLLNCVFHSLFNLVEIEDGNSVPCCTGRAALPVLLAISINSLSPFMAVRAASRFKLVKSELVETVNIVLLFILFEMR